MAPQGSNKKGLGPLAWIGIGCGAVALIALVVVVAGGLFVAKKGKDFVAEMEKNPELTTARTFVRLNPELEEVAVDEEAGTITVRNTTNGEEITVDWSEIRDGKLRFSSGDQDVTIEGGADGDGGTFKVSGADDEGGFELSTGNSVDEEIPEWVPVPEGTEPTNRHTMTNAGGSTGGFQIETDRGVAEILDVYRERLGDDGFSVRVNTFDGDGESGGTVNGSDDSSGRSIVVMVRSEGAKTSITVSYRQQ